MIEAMLVAGTIELIPLTKLDGRIAYINPLQILQLEESRSSVGKTNQHFTDEVHCIVTLSGGSYITVREHCHDIRKLFVPSNEK